MFHADFLSLYFYLIDKLYQKQLSLDLSFTGLERYFVVLWLIDKGEETLSQQNLADLLKMDKAAVVRILNDLEKKGFVERIAHPSDQRSYQIRLTRKAKKNIPNLQEAIENLNEEAMLGFSTDEKQQFLRLLGKMYENLTPNPLKDILIDFGKKLDEKKPKTDTPTIA